MPYDDTNEAHSEIYKGFHISIQYDRDPLNPRKEWDHAATMVCFHRRYDLGDEHDYSEPTDAVADICGIDRDDLDYADDRDEAVAKALAEFTGKWLPLYLYDHSGITMNTGGFSCPWDSGQVGIIYVTKETIDKEWPLQDDETEEARGERVLEYLRGEVEEYDNYLTGNVYGYCISTVDEDGDPDEEIEDGSCWGFSGDYEYCLSEAKELIDGIHEC